MIAIELEIMAMKVIMLLYQDDYQKIKYIGKKISLCGIRS